MPSVLISKCRRHVGCGNLLQRLRFPHRGSRHQDIEPPEGLQHRVEKPGHSGFFAQVRCKRRGADTQRFQLHDRFASFVGRVIVVYGNVATALGQGRCHGIPNTALTAAGNQHNF